VRRTGMRVAITPAGVTAVPAILLQFLVITLPLISLSACGTARSDGAGPDNAVDLPSNGGSITVSVTYQKGGPVYTEGAVTVVNLLDAAGEQQEPADGSSENTRVFGDLPRGEYRLVGGVRPCDANCGMLDPLTDTCSAQVPVESHPVRVELLVLPGSPCRITVHGS